MCVCNLIATHLYSITNVGVCCVPSEINTTHTGICSSMQAGFDKFTNAYLCTPRTHKGFKGTFVNRALPSMH